MSRRYHILLAVLILLLPSCAKENSGGWGDHYLEGETADFLAILTIKKTPTDTVYFQLDDSTTIYAANYQYDYTRMEKVFCDISVTNRPEGRFKYKGYINWLEPIEEGQVTADASASGNLGLDILDDWMTSVEDGYLTIHYNTWWGSKPVQHKMYVITGTNPADPYELVLRQDACGDKKDEKGDALICFDINSLPETGDNYTELKLKWTSSGGTAAEKTFKFKTRK
ncbi:MAG: hypothetical protein J5769_01450 [Bacteroidales bacterium]|nr:hypothetical protein [Bacteroidales bacterium]